MKTIIEKVYHCEFCKKYGRSAGAMARHEKYCASRPENRHKCFDECTHLKMSCELINGKYPESRYSYKTVFTCAADGSKLYSYLLEKNMNFKPEFIEGLKRMPVQCAMHKYMTEEEIEQRFNPSYND